MTANFMSASGLLGVVAERGEALQGQELKIIHHFHLNAQINGTLRKTVVLDKRNIDHLKSQMKYCVLEN